MSNFLVTSCLEDAAPGSVYQTKKIKSQVFFPAQLFLLVLPHDFRIALLLCVTQSSVGEDKGEDAHGQVYDMSVIHA